MGKGLRNSESVPGIESPIRGILDKQWQERHLASLRQMNGTGSETIPGASGSIRSDAEIKPIFQTSDQVEKGRSAATRTRATDCTHPEIAHELAKIRAIAAGTRQNEQTLPLRIIPAKHRRHCENAIMPNQNDHWSGEGSIKKTCFVDHFVAQSPAQEVYQNRTKPNQDARQKRKLVNARRISPSSHVRILV